MAGIEFAPAIKTSTRSRDLKGQQFEWTDLKIVHTFDDDSKFKGHAVAYVDHPEDLARLGKTMGHCAGTHFIWACEERIWGFFTVITTADMQPHTTLHAKELKWVGKPHPRDTAEFPYASASSRSCARCLSYGGFRANGQPYYWGSPGIVKCDACDGTGRQPVKLEKNQVPHPKPSSGGYPSYADVVAAFESVGRKYEAGKYAPVSFSSRTYEIEKNFKERIANFEGTFGYNLIKSRPNGVEDGTWAEYEKVIAAMKAQFDKGNGAVQIVGRVFKFDKKEWYVLSFSARGQGDTNSTYRGMMHEFFVECSKRPKKEANDK